MVVCDPPDASEHKTQYIAEKFWRHRQQTVFQSRGNILVLHLGNVNFQYEKSNDDREDPIAECLDARSRFSSLPFTFRRTRKQVGVARDKVSGTRRRSSRDRPDAEVRAGLI